ncbi:MAG TPA: 6-carboxytetrahydropterin synthase QueD [bacterium]|nr:6-carboxytetrahydropterin synthase QueD [bacterium]
MFFSSAHNLRDYNGKCENIHGHNWKVRLYLSREKLDKTGFVMDFKELDKILKKITDKIDHTNLNCVEPFDEINPTAENISRFIYSEAVKEIRLISSDIKVVRSMVWESDKSCAIYEE